MDIKTVSLILLLTKKTLAMTAFDEGIGPGGWTVVLTGLITNIFASFTLQDLHSTIAIVAGLLSISYLVMKNIMALRKIKKKEEDDEV